MLRVPRVSIVDDDESARIAMSSLVRSAGYDACEFSSAEDFLSSSELENASCVIADVQMPGMNGLELQAVLVDRYPSLPVIIITGFAEERIRRRAEETGAVGFFGKPVDISAIIECLDHILRRD